MQTKGEEKEKNVCETKLQAIAAKWQAKGRKDGKVAME